MRYVGRKSKGRRGRLFFPFFSFPLRVRFWILRYPFILFTRREVMEEQQRAEAEEDCEHACLHFGPPSMESKGGESQCKDYQCLLLAEEGF